MMASLVIVGDRHVPKSGDMSSRDFSVVAARRIWSPAEKQRIVDQASVPGVNISAVARNNGVAQSLLYRWRKDAAAANTKPPAFVAVAMPPPQTNAVEHSRHLPSLIEIEVSGGRKLRVGTGIDIELLKRIVVALETS